MSAQLFHDLIRRRRELTCEIERLKREARSLADDVAAIDRTLGLFDPMLAAETIAPLHHRPQSDWAKPGENARAIMAALREAKEPLTARQVGEAVMISRCLSPDAHSLTGTFGKRIHKSLVLLRGKGVVRSSVKQDGRLLWEVAR